MIDTDVMTYKPDDGPEFQWHGGEYIEVGYTAEVDTGPFNDQGQPSFYAGQFVSHDVINVWDNANNKPYIERTQEAFEAECEAWLAGEYS